MHHTGDLCSCWEAQLSLGPISKGAVVVPSLSGGWWFPLVGLETKTTVPGAVKAQGLFLLPEALPWHLPPSLGLGPSVNAWQL